MNQTINNKIKVYCIKRKLNKIKRARTQELNRLIDIYPGRMNHIDNIEDLDPNTFLLYDRKIEKIESLLKQKEM